MKAQWLTTSPNPRVRGYGPDDGQRGWRLHAVICEDATSRADANKLPALCGLRPRHGWGLDLFIQKPCARCESARKARGLNAVPVEWTR